MTQKNNTAFIDNLECLKLRFIKEHYEKCSQEAARLGTSHIDYLSQPIEG
jgi:hypothetical protein